MAERPDVRGRGGAGAFTRRVGQHFCTRPRPPSLRLLPHGPAAAGRRKGPDPRARGARTSAMRTRGRAGHSGEAGCAGEGDARRSTGGRRWRRSSGSYFDDFDDAVLQLLFVRGRQALGLKCSEEVLLHFLCAKQRARRGGLTAGKDWRGTGRTPREVVEGAGVRWGGGGGLGSKNSVYQKWPDQIFPFSRDGHFGLGRGGGSSDGVLPFQYFPALPPPPLRRNNSKKHWKWPVVLTRDVANTHPKTPPAAAPPQCPARA